MVELTVLDWDITLVSETRAESSTVELEGGHRLYLHREDYSASSVGVLIHARLVGSIRSTPARRTMGECAHKSGSRVKLGRRFVQVSEAAREGQSPLPR